MGSKLGMNLKVAPVPTSTHAVCVGRCWRGSHVRSSFKASCRSLAFLALIVVFTPTGDASSGSTSPSEIEPEIRCAGRICY